MNIIENLSTTLKVVSWWSGTWDL